MELVLHPKTLGQVTVFVEKPVHGLLLVGNIGVGKLSIAQYIATTLLNVDHLNLLRHPYYQQITPEGSITIDQVRELKNFLLLKTTGSDSIRRLVVIEQAELMTLEAQNALLKLLEEPPKDTVLILTSSQPQKLLATIRSRIREIAIMKPAKADVLEFFSTNDQPEVIKAYHMSDGNIGLMHTLLNTDEEHPLAANINLAKEILKKTTYERLLLVNELANKDTIQLLNAIYSVCNAALKVAVEKDDQKRITEWYKRCKTIHSAQDELAYKPQNKLLLTHIMMSL